MWRVNAYKERIGFLLSSFGALMSGLGVIVPLLLSSHEITWWIIALIGTFVVLMVLAATIVLKSETTNRVYRADDKLGIRNYMIRWIRDGGQVVIWTRDMSWADDDHVKQLLCRKARSHEVIICLPRETETTDYLKQNGAEIVTYGAWDSPAASFTIANFNRAGSRVAVGRRKGAMHIIQEFSAGEHSSFDMAHDLVRLLREGSTVGGKGTGC